MQRPELFIVSILLFIPRQWRMINTESFSPAFHDLFTSIAGLWQNSYFWQILRGLVVGYMWVKNGLFEADTLAFSTFSKHANNSVTTSESRVLFFEKRDVIRHVCFSVLDENA